MARVAAAPRNKSSFVFEEEGRVWEAALAQGAKVLVVTPADSKAAAAIANRARQAGVPVIAYDALINDAPLDYFVSFQDDKVGELQGSALVDKLKQDGTIDKGEIVAINGAPTDNNAGQFKKDAHTALDGKVTDICTGEYAAACEKAGIN